MMPMTPRMPETVESLTLVRVVPVPHGFVLMLYAVGPERADDQTTYIGLMHSLS